jgi:C4-dicarboxylate-specific signal transduction histidine kinase
MFKPSDEPERFLVYQAIDSVYNIYKETLSNMHFEYTKQCTCDDLYLFGHKEEFLQVISSLISNAKDILIEHNIENPKIAIVCGKIDDKFKLTICDKCRGSML